MINTVTRARKLGPLLAAATFAIAAPVLAQAPSQAQRDAIKSQCRSDYMARCSSVPPGGEAALQCLQKNMSSLSSGCQSAVRAVEAPAAAPAKPAETAKPAEPAKPAETAAPKSAAPAAATAAPAKSAEPKTAAAPPAGQPSSAQISAIRSACRSDYPKVCAGVPTGGAPALQCLEKNKAKLSAGCEKAVSAASGGGAAPAAAVAAPAAAGAAATAAPAAAPITIVLRPMRPREELFVLRSACGADVRTICGGVPAGGGRIVQCLATNAAQLSPACKDVLSQFAAR
ncbi:cysteine rich repeat-containing protein [Bradyrhizobium murdochi]|uniref:cysteine rich repeat-containing protein n=1 Tax=Bradyrhizobium murdochi TaxID=1038859 RepID=UPI00041E84FC|nr:cysteine rich repeat-containing protein [Bradyrhizobium murdochi]